MMTMASAPSPMNGYIIAALISAVPATIGSIAAWRNSRAGRRENSNDHAIVQQHLTQLDGQMQSVNTGLMKVDVGLVKLDLRLDAIEDKVDRHLGWHRAEAEKHLPSALQESRDDRQQ